jgi:hypothetical protein
MAGVKRFEASLAIGASLENLTVGTFLERLGMRPEVLSVYGVIDTYVAPANSGLFTFDLRLGNVIVADRLSVPQYTNVQGPDREKHLIARAVGAPFDLVQLRLFNGSTVATPYRFLLEATAL